MMDLESYLKNTMTAMRADKLKETNQMTLGELIAKLEAIPPRDNDEDKKTVHYDFECLVPTTLDSWRGAYDELALGWAYTGYAPEGCPDMNHKNQITVEELLKDLKSAVGKTFTGWKGGDFVMSKTTPIWIANPGNAGNTGITEVVDEGYKVTLMTGYYEF